MSNSEDMARRPRCPTCGHIIARVRLKSTQGRPGGLARAASLTPERRREIAAMGQRGMRGKGSEQERRKANA